MDKDNPEEFRDGPCLTQDVWLPAKLFLCVALGGVTLAIILSSVVVTDI